MAGEKRFTNIFGDTEVTGVSPDANQDYYLITDNQQDHNYWQTKIAEALKYISVSPLSAPQILFGGEVTDGGSGSINISAGAAIGFDPSDNPRVYYMPPVTAAPVTVAWRDGRALWAIGRYLPTFAPSTRLHFIGQPYHFQLDDSYLGVDAPVSIVADSVVANDVVWGKFTMTGTTFALGTTRSPIFSAVSIATSGNLGSSDTVVPSQNAVKTYVDNNSGVGSDPVADMLIHNVEHYGEVLWTQIKTPGFAPVPSAGTTAGAALSTGTYQYKVSFVPKIMGTISLITSGLRAVGYGGNYLWVGADSGLYKIDVKKGSIKALITLYSADNFGLVYGEDGYLWACGSTSPVLVKLNSVLTPVGSVTLGTAGLRAVCDAYGYLWVAFYNAAIGAVIWKVDKSVLSFTTINVGVEPWDICGAGNYIWVSNNSGNSITVINPFTCAIVGTVTPPVNNPQVMDNFQGVLWCYLAATTGLFCKIDLTLLTVLGTVLPVAAGVSDFCGVGDYLWIFAANSYCYRYGVKDGSVLSLASLASGTYSNAAFDGQYLWAIDMSATNLLGKINPFIVEDETDCGVASLQAYVTVRMISLDNIPLSPDLRVGGRRLYRSFYGSSVPYRYVGQINDNTTTVYTDNLALAVINTMATVAGYPNEPSANKTGGAMIAGEKLVARVF